MGGRAGKKGTRRPTGGTVREGPGALDDLAVFVAVAENASFAETSRRLAIPTSSVSRAVARLESDLGVPLLRRTSRTVAVTDEGRNLLERAAGHVEGLREALAVAADGRVEPSGVVRVTAPAFTGTTRVAQALASFALAHPRIAIELDASNALRDLVHDGYDFGIRVGPRADADFVVRRLWQGRFGLFAAREIVRTTLGGTTHLTRSALEAAPCVALRAPIAWRFVDDDGQATAITPASRFVVNDPRCAVEMARRGLGVVLAPLDAVGEDDAALVPLTTELGEPQPVDLYLVYPARRLLPLRARLVIDWLIADAARATKPARASRRRNR